MSTILEFSTITRGPLTALLVQITKEQNSKKNSTKLKNDYKISTGTENLQKCSKCNLLFFWKPLFEHRCYQDFFSKGKAQIKKRKTCSPPLSLGVQKIQKRFGSVSHRFGVKW